MRRNEEQPSNSPWVNHYKRLGIFELLSLLPRESLISGRKGEAEVRPGYINEDKDDPVVSGDPRKSAKETSVERGVSLDGGRMRKDERRRDAGGGEGSSQQ